MIKRLKPVIYLTLLNIIGFTLLYFFVQPANINIVYAGVIVCGVNILIYIVMYLPDMGDVYLFLMVSALVSLGIIMLFRLDVDNFGFAQTVWFCGGIAIFLVVYFIFRSFKHWHKLYFVYMAVAVALFLMTLLFGTYRNGAKNWIAIGGQTFQPSEFIKILYMFVLACFFSMNESKIEFFSRKYFGVPGKDIALNIFVFVCLGFLVLQREWGTAVLFFLVFFAMMFMYNTSWKLIILNLIIAGSAAVGGYFLTDHIKVRVSTWLDPWADATNRGYQITQSLFAITSGGYFGTGIGNGTPHFIPEVYSDFIFSAICEEMGIFTGIAIIMIYFIFSYRGFKIAINAKNEFLKALTMAFTVSFAFQTFIIVGGVTKLIPLTGITLPFVSYGGSSMISCFIMLGIITAVSYIERKN